MNGLIMNDFEGETRDLLDGKTVERKVSRKQSEMNSLYFQAEQDIVLNVFEKVYKAVTLKTYNCLGTLKTLVSS
jgi:hypothetical protein